jgi:hypothetical protein
MGDHHLGHTLADNPCVRHHVGPPCVPTLGEAIAGLPLGGRSWVTPTVGPTLEPPLCVPLCETHSYETLLGEHLGAPPVGPTLRDHECVTHPVGTILVDPPGGPPMGTDPVETPWAAELLDTRWVNALVDRHWVSPHGDTRRGPTCENPLGEPIWWTALGTPIGGPPLRELPWGTTIS